LLLAVVGWSVFSIFQNTQANLARRGIASGFSFLSNEAGFGISEVLPVPRLDPAFLLILALLAGGILATLLLKRVLRARGLTIGGDYRLILTALFLVVGLPTLALYWVGGALVADLYDETGSYGLALVTGVFNTVKVSALACLAATAIGFAVGIARLSDNWLVARLAGAYVEVVRNIPLLLQIFFWYFAVLSTLPGVAESLHPLPGVIINNRGVYLPEPEPLAGFHPFLLAFLASVVGVYFWLRHVRLTRERSGAHLPVFFPGLAILVAGPGFAWLVAGAPVRLSFPVLEGFNFVGGLNFSPEFAAMLLGLSIYTGAFIAEIVRGGIQAVSRGQKEAAAALGLKPDQVMWLVVIPQALRVIVPPLTSQYLNATKNSSLGVAIAYPELVSIGGTTLNQSGQAIEVIAITMAVYLTFSLLISVFMNWFNARVALEVR
ncbi:MAG: ABC transporter permease subunit, partial [bacterium]